MKFFIFTFFNLLLVVVHGTPLEKFVSGNKLFTAAVYREIAKTTHENILVSPFSTEIVLALTQSGAKGETGEEIRNNLHLPNTKEETEEATKELLSAIKRNENYSLHTASKIYVKKDVSLKTQFKTIATTIYQSEVENIDFTQNEQAANTMNKWIEEHTNNKIHNLISPDNLDETTTAILVNALHFKGDWKKPFSNMLTRKGKFYKTSQDVVEVDMMNCAAERSYNYHANAELDAVFLELPFKCENLSMVIALPNQKEGISILEKQLEQVFAEHPFRRKDVFVAIPKFTFENKIDFKQILIDLGIKKIFDKTQADLSEIAGSKGFLFVDSVQQKSFIDVNEIGVEAAAASFVEMVFLSAHHGTPITFVADHPFIFYIKFDNIILFAGRVSIPTQQNEN